MKFFNFLDEKGGFYYEVRFPLTRLDFAPDILSCSVGEMPPFTVSVQPSSLRRNKLYVIAIDPGQRVI